MGGWGLEVAGARGKGGGSSSACVGGRVGQGGF